MFKRLLPLCLAGLTLAAQPAHREGRPAFMAQLKALDLSEAQRASVRQTLANHKDALKAKTAAAREARRAMVDALLQPETTEAKLKSLHDTAAKAQFEVLKEGRAIHQEISPVLTPEQQAKAAELKADFRGRMDGLRQFVFGN
jgi:Spy/CpxP family protein refolding chaperone